MTNSLAGHINHLYEDHTLTISEIKKVIRKICNSDIVLYEKLDGQNLFIKWDFDANEIRFARNKKHIRLGGLNLSNMDKYFNDKDIIKLFSSVYNELNNFFSQFNNNDLYKVFGSTGNIWFPIEVINSDFFNVIKYDSNHIVFHHYYPLIFDTSGEVIAKAVNRHLLFLKHLCKNKKHKSYIIKVANEFEIANLNNNIFEQVSIKLNKFCDNNNIGEYTSIKKFLFTSLLSQTSDVLFIHPDVKKEIIKNIIRYPGFKKINEIKKHLDIKTLDLVKIFISSLKNELYPNTLFELEKIINDFSYHFLSYCNSDYILDEQKEAKRIKRMYDDSLSLLNKQENIHFLRKKLENINNAFVAIEGFVFEYNDKLYKITGYYRYINNIIGMTKYKKEEKKTGYLPISIG